MAESSEKIECDVLVDADLNVKETISADTAGGEEVNVTSGETIAQNSDVTDGDPNEGSFLPASSVSIIGASFEDLRINQASGLNKSSAEYEEVKQHVMKMQMSNELLKLRTLQSREKETSVDAASLFSQHTSDVQTRQSQGLKFSKTLRKHISQVHESLSQDASICIVNIVRDEFNFPEICAEPKIEVLNNRYQVSLDVSPFNENNILLEIVGSKISVFAKVKHENQYGLVTHEMDQVFQIPARVSKDKFKACITLNNILVISAPIDFTPSQSSAEISR